MQITGHNQKSVKESTTKPGKVQRTKQSKEVRKQNNTHHETHQENTHTRANTHAYTYKRKQYSTSKRCKQAAARKQTNEQAGKQK